MERGDGGIWGKIPPKRANRELWGKRESFEKRERVNRTKRAVFILLGRIHPPTPHTPPSHNPPSVMHQVNYDEPPDHDQMMAEDQHNCAGITSAGDGALKRPHLKDGATTGDDRKCQKTQLPVTLRIQYPIDEPKLRKYAAPSAASTVRRHDDANPKGETGRVIIKQFLKNVTDGNCNVEYDHREIGGALIAHSTWLFDTRAHLFTATVQKWRIRATFTAPSTRALLAVLRP